MVIANASHRFIVGEQLRAVGFPPAAAAAALIALERDEDPILLIMPADHVVRSVAAFHQAVDSGVELVRRGLLVLFGVEPDRPATGYGYIRKGAPIEDRPGASHIEAFVEKPDRARAEALLAQGCLWNSGIFLMSARQLVAELERYAPRVLASVRAAVSKASQDLDFTRLDVASFAESPAISLKPGITGWAQVNGFRGPTDTENKIKNRVAHDFYYIDNWSLGFDLYIVLMTLISARAYSNAH